MTQEELADFISRINPCFEKTYKKDGVFYMDVYIATEM